MELPSERDAKQRGATNELKASESAALQLLRCEVEPPLRGDDAGVQPEAALWAGAARPLPQELWLVIMRELSSMRDHHAFALTCALFAALARAEAEKSKRRLALEADQSNRYRWSNIDIIEVKRITGPCLANGRFHGRCLAHCSHDHLIEFEAQDGLRQGEARLLHLPMRWLRGTFCFVNDKLEGLEVMYTTLSVSTQRSAYYEDDEREGPSLLCIAGRLVYLQCCERGKLEGYSVYCNNEGTPSTISYNEDGLLMAAYTNHINGSSATVRHREIGAGWTISYHENGSLHELAYYEDNRGEGSVYMWHDNGQLASTHNFTGGFMTKTGPAWDREGDLLGEN